MADIETLLTRWQSAGVLDAEAADRIRAFESESAAADRSSGLRWQGMVALILGTILLGCGVVLFVSAHWDDLGPGARYALVIAMVAVFHLGGAWARGGLSWAFDGAARRGHHLHRGGDRAGGADLQHSGALAGGDTAVGHGGPGGMDSAPRRGAGDAYAAAVSGLDFVGVFVLRQRPHRRRRLYRPIPDYLVHALPHHFSGLTAQGSAGDSLRRRGRGQCLRYRVGAGKLESRGRQTRPFCLLARSSGAGQPSPFCRFAFLSSGCARA